LSHLPSLVMDASTDQAGRFGVNVLYEADYVSWTSRYVLFYDQEKGVLDRFSCVVDLTNNSGRPLEDATFKLIAADNDSGEGALESVGGARMAMFSEAPMADMQVDGADSESVGNQTLYTLPEPLTVAHGGTQQSIL